MLFPMFNDFIFTRLYDFLYFGQFSRIQSVINCQGYDRFKPKFCFAMLTCYMDVHTIFLI